MSGTATPSERIAFDLRTQNSSLVAVNRSDLVALLADLGRAHEQAKAVAMAHQIGPQLARHNAQPEAHKAAKVRAAIIRTLDVAPGSSTDIAERLGVSVLSVRPRLSQLSRVGAIVPTGRFSQTAAGKDETVWRLA